VILVHTYSSWLFKNCIHIWCNNITNYAVSASFAQKNIDLSLYSYILQVLYLIFHPEKNSKKISKKSIPPKVMKLFNEMSLQGIADTAVDD